VPLKHYQDLPVSTKNTPTNLVVLKNNYSIFDFNYIVILQYKYIAMGITKTEYFTEEQNELAILAKALAICSYQA
jgi:hypothetical protein